MRLLFVAADPMEFSGLVKCLRDTGSPKADVDWARTGRLQEHDAMLVANGAGRGRAAAALDAGCRFCHPDAVVNLGFCGALDPSLEIAALVTGDVACEGRHFAARPFPPTHACRTGLVFTLDRVAQTAAEKSALRRTGAVVVEMEAAGVAEEAEKRGLPFYCLKAVTDLANESFANDFNASLRSDGHFDTISILRGTLRHPVIRLPELLRLKDRCARAARTLGEFFADCRF